MKRKYQIFYSYISGLILLEWLPDWVKRFAGNNNVNAKQIAFFCSFSIFSCSNGVTAKCPTLLQRSRKVLKQEHIRQEDFMLVVGLQDTEIV